VANIFSDDDVAVKDSLYTQGRRGVGTTILAEKICGAAAEQGYDLKQLAALCRRVNLNGRSIGMALTSCTPPAKGSPMFELGENEIEFGIGIHGEPGRKRLPLVSADEITAMLAQSIFEDTGYTRILREWNEDQQDWEEVELTDPNLEKGDRVLAFVNSMGGTPLSELYIIYRKLAQICSEQNIQIVRNLVGPYITSLEMQGCSITLLKLDDGLLKLWDAPVQTPALRWGV
jgi:dihydroxyacetone kinase-like protein